MSVRIRIPVIAGLLEEEEDRHWKSAKNKILEKQELRIKILLRVGESSELDGLQDFVCFSKRFVVRLQDPLAVKEPRMPEPAI